MTSLPSVLLIDDETKFRTYFHECLEEEVEQNLIEIETAGDAIEGLKIIECQQKKQVPIYVFFDVILPGISGIELIEKINLKSRHPSGCIISAHKQLFELEEIKNKYDWLNGCFLKPLKEEALRQKVKEFLEKSSISKLEYGGLDQGTALFLIEETKKIQSIMKRTVKDIIEIGESLHKIKSKLNYGQFLLWTEKQLSLDYTTAANFMRVYDTFGERKEEISEMGLGISVLYVLSSRNATEEFREEVFRRARAGIKLSFGETKQLKKDYLERDKIQQQKFDNQNSSTKDNQNSSTFFEDPVTIDVNSSVDSEPTSELDNTVAKPQEIIKVVREQKVWNLGSHILYCGLANSPEFKNLLKSLTISFNIGFPSFSNWTQEDLFPVPAQSTLVYNSLSSVGNSATNTLLFFDMLKKSIEFSTEEENKILVSFSPYPEIILLIEKLNCQAFIAEPDKEKCRAIINTWNKHEAELFHKPEQL